MPIGKFLNEMENRLDGGSQKLFTLLGGRKLRLPNGSRHGKFLKFVDDVIRLPLQHI